VSVFHEVLSAAQRTLLQRVGPFSHSRGFYLGGGTAVALQLAHRKSDDFDWFTPKPLADAHALARDLQSAAAGFELTGLERGTLNGVASGVHMSFLEYLYPLLNEPVPAPECGFSMASLDDLGAMKLSAVCDRNTRRDFVDLYALITRHAPLERLLQAFQKKYKTRQIAHIFTALTFFEDAERQRMPPMLWNVTWATIRKTIVAAANEAARKDLRL
jgi:hypothetical protein